MIELKDKIVSVGLPILIFLLVLVLLFLQNTIFFWGKYIENLLFLIIVAVVMIRFIVAPIKLIIKLKKDKNTGFGYLNTWVYLQDERKRQKKEIFITCVSSIPIIAFGVWFGSSNLKEVALMTKDIPYVLGGSYSEVYCFVKYNEIYRPKGGPDMQYIEAINMADAREIYISFEHEHKKINELSYYTIWYLPNTKLGARAEERP